MQAEQLPSKKQEAPERRVIGVTGGIGSGKSRASSFLAQEYNLPLINLDIVCRDLLQPDNAGWQALRKLLPDVYFSPTGELDRAYFRQQLFADTSLREQVDATLHPLARQEMVQKIELLTGLVLVEIPLLFEAGWQDDVDCTLVIYADMAARIQRIIDRDQVSREQAQQAIATQQCLREKAAHADYVIDNSGSWQHTCALLHHWLTTILDEK
ncbi:MAG: dephospho-CoA kinase [Candidatus Electrothrix scaldis]|nr:MAG: dephospho-CoA kinase [Candidatus Electrothrix sp. GW3-3]